MSPRASLRGLSARIEALVDAPDRLARARALLGAVEDLGLAEAAALWWLAGPRDEGGERAWRPVLARGPEALLPPACAVHALARGGLGQDLGDGRHVLAAGPRSADGSARWALALGGTPAELPGSAAERGAEEALEWAEVLLVTFASVDAAAEAGPDAEAERLEPWIAPLAPTQPPPRAGALAELVRRVADDEGPLLAAEGHALHLCVEPGARGNAEQLPAEVAARVRELLHGARAACGPAATLRLELRADGARGAARLALRVEASTREGSDAAALREFALRWGGELRVAADGSGRPVLEVELPL